MIFDGERTVVNDLSKGEGLAMASLPQAWIGYLGPATVVFSQDKMVVVVAPGAVMFSGSVDERLRAA
jgi:hypothetical protein